MLTFDTSCLKTELRVPQLSREKLDGSGYPSELTGKDLSLDARLLTVADIYGALGEDRLYHSGLGIEKIRSIMSSEVPHKIDADCYEALMHSLDRDPPKLVRPLPTS